MKTRNRRIFALVFVLLVTILACNMPNVSSTPLFVFSTPNQTMTALFNPILEDETRITPTRATQTSTTVDPTERSSSTLDPSITAIPYTLTPSLTPTTSYVGPGLRPGTSLVARYLTDVPKINGDLSDWDLSIYPSSHVVYGSSNWEDEKDLSAALMVGWDELFLYLGGRIKDEKYVQNKSGEFLYLGDSVEVLLDTDVSQDFYFNSLNSDDYQLGVSPGSPTKGIDPEAYLWYPRSSQGSCGQIQIGVLATPNGYHIELAIPWEVFEINPYIDQHLGFAFSVSDNDKGNQDVQESMISNISTRVLTKPMTWGDLTLSE